MPVALPESGAQSGIEPRAWAPTRPGVIASLVFLAWMLPGLIGHDPWKPDEGYTFGLVNHILRSGDWVVPTLAGEPFMEKPPIFFLVAALFARIAAPVLPLYDGARLASAFFIGIAVLFTACTSRTLLPTRPAWVAPMLLIGSAGLLIHAHQLVTDNALLCGFAIALYGFALALRKPLAGGLWLGIGTGLGFMAKGLLAPGVIGITALLLPALYAQWRTRAYLVVLQVAALTAAPWIVIWPVALYLRSPALFVDWFWTNNFGRFFGFAGLGPAAEPYAYPKLMLWFALPSLPLALRALWLRRRALPTDAGLQIATTLFAVTYVVLCAAADAREVYAMPLLLPLALLGVTGLENLPARVARPALCASVLLFSALMLAVWACWLALETGAYAPLSDLLAQRQPSYAGHVGLWPLGIAVAFSAGWLLLIRWRQAAYRGALIWAAGIATVWGLLGTLMLGWFDTGMSYRRMLPDMVRALPAERRCIASRSLGESQRAIFDYFSGIVTERGENPAARKDCDLLLVQSLNSPPASPGASWVRIWDGARAGDKREHFWLYRQRPAEKQR